MHISLCHFCVWDRLSSSGPVFVCLGVLVACMWLVHESMNPPAAQISTIPQTIHLSNLLANKSAYLSFYQPICHVSDRSNYLSIYLSIYVFSAEKLTVRKFNTKPHLDFLEFKTLFRIDGTDGLEMNILRKVQLYPKKR